jgi:hypothetical protein
MELLFSHHKKVKALSWGLNWFIIFSLCSNDFGLVLMLKFSSKFLLVVFMDESLLLYKCVGAWLDFEDFIFDPCLYIISWLLVRFQMILSQDQCQKAHHKFCFPSFILFTWFRICFSKKYDLVSGFSCL